MATTDSTVVSRDEMIGNLASELAAVTTRRLATLLDLYRLIPDDMSLGTRFAQIALEEFDGLDADLHDVLVDREWDGPTVGPEETNGAR